MIKYVGSAIHLSGSSCVVLNRGGKASVCSDVSFVSKVPVGREQVHRTCIYTRPITKGRGNTENINLGFGSRYIIALPMSNELLAALLHRYSLESPQNMRLFFESTANVESVGYVDKCQTS